MISADSLKEQFEKEFFNDTLKSAFNWLVRFTYWHGWRRGMAAYKEKVDSKLDHYISTADWMLRPEQLTFSWYSTRGGCLDVNIESNDKRDHSISFFSDEKETYRVLGRNDMNGREKEFIVSLATSIDQMILKFFPNIRQINGVRFCSSPIHFYGDLSGKGSLASSTRPVMATCKPLDNKWLCDDCLQRYSLTAPKPPAPKETKRERSEREKMTASLRFSILERDSFTCRKCGRSPSKGDNVILHVDHIRPVAKGGKTEASNLETLCSICNLGKGTQIVGQ